MSSKYWSIGAYMRKRARKKYGKYNKEYTGKTEKDASDWMKESRYIASHDMITDKKIKPTWKYKRVGKIVYSKFVG